MFELMILGCIILVCVAFGGLIYICLKAYNNYIENTISTKYPQYVKACKRLSRIGHENMSYYNENVRKYEKQIEELEAKLRWLPKEERDKIIEEIETLKIKRLEYYKIWELKSKDLEKARETVDAIRAANPWLQKHG
jgi:uncharacterized coiled-coil DUF342 family protein